MFDNIIRTIFNLVNMLVAYLWWDASSLIAHSKQEKQIVIFSYSKGQICTYVYYRNLKILDN